MAKRALSRSFLWILCSSAVLAAPPQEAGPAAHFGFDGGLDADSGNAFRSSGEVSFTRGLVGEAVRLNGSTSSASLTYEGSDLPERGHDFSVSFWVRTTTRPDRRMVLASRKQVADNSLAAQKQPGWAYSVSDGTWAWSVGSGDRRLTYERDNGEKMPLNDGRWHQLTMTYASALAEVRLYYDGHNKVVYNVADADGFDFSNDEPLVVGWDGVAPSPADDVAPAIHRGAAVLQQLVDGFDALGLPPVEAEELVHLIVDPEGLFERKLEVAEGAATNREQFPESLESVDFTRVSEIEAALMENPYTIHQAVTFMETAPAMKIYSLVDGVVTVDEAAAQAYTERERLYLSEFEVDELSLWDRVVSPDEVLNAYAEHFEPVPADLDVAVGSITAAVWNIFHGGKHFTVEEHGWDSRVAIAQMLEREGVDVLMMQETYSSGDFIAAELGYFFATTVDWDYLNQGANISVLSRYPIRELHVEGESPFMNIGVKVAISDTQDLYVMSNWYGMRQFPTVFEFHQARFAESDTIPTVFGGDFNAIPHTDGGDSPASRVLLEAGFTDAYRHRHPDVEASPGHTHRSGSRIDQLYYKGAGLRNTSTRIISTRPGGFPSDHYLIVSEFDLQTEEDTRVENR